MKLDGSAEEIRDLFQNNDSNLKDLIREPPTQLTITFIVIPCVIFLLSLFILCLLPVGSPQWEFNFLYIISFSSGTWTCASTQLRFKHTAATFCVAIGLLLTFLITAGLISPRDAVETVKSLKSK
jgi:ABC-type Fe3+ transport system permease subunit